METADPSTASSLEAKMNELSKRFCKARNKHKKKLEDMEKLKTRVELFECLSDKLQSFFDKKTQALNEADIPGKDVAEMFLCVQVQYIFQSSAVLTFTELHIYEVTIRFKMITEIVTFKD